MPAVPPDIWITETAHILCVCRSELDHGLADDALRVAAPHWIGPHPTADRADPHRDRYFEEKTTGKLQIMCL
jgi:hypothetical protein